MRLLALSTATLLLAGALTVPGPSAAPPSSAPSTAPSVSPTAPIDTFGSWFQVTDDDEGTRAGLWVGRLGGEAFHVVDQPIVDANGPVGGTVIARRSLSDHQTFSLVDTADGSMVEVLRTTNGDAPILSPDGRTMYWAELTTDTHGDVWRMQLPDGEHERILHDVPIYRGAVTLSTDGRYLALAIFGGDLSQYVVVDTRTLRTWDVPVQAGEVVGFLGRHLVTHSEPESEESRFPLRAIDPRDGSMRIVAPTGGFPAIVPDADGRGVLVWTIVDEQGARLVVRESVRGPRRTILVDHDGGLGSDMVRPSYMLGMEIPGYVATFPDGHAFVWPEIAHRYEGQPRSFVSIADGSVIELEPVMSSPAP